jgi:hypothetical protein
MSERKACVRCGLLVRGPRAEHRQTKYCGECARIKKRENTLNPLLPEEKREYMRGYMREYRRTHPGLSSPYVRRHRERKREAGGESSGGQPSAPTSASPRCHAGAVILTLLFFRGDSSEGWGVSLEDLSALIPRLELLLVEVAGLVFVALVCWRHLADFWRNRKK